MKQTDDLTVAAGSRERAWLGAVRGEAWWHDALGTPPTTCGATWGMIHERTDLPDHWYRLPRIRPGQLVEWTRGEAWGVAPYSCASCADTGHYVGCGDGTEIWVETVSPAPAVAYPEQVRVARQLIAAQANGGDRLARETLRRMDGVK